MCRDLSLKETKLTPTTKMFHVEKHRALKHLPSCVQSGKAVTSWDTCQLSFPKGFSTRALLHLKFITSAAVSREWARSRLARLEGSCQWCSVSDAASRVFGMAHSC